MLGEERRAGGVYQTLVKHVLHCGISAGQRVTHHDAVRSGFQVCRLITLSHTDAGLLQHCAHGRVQAGIRTAHLVSQCAGEQSHAPHERAADAEYMNVHSRLARPTEDEPVYVP